MASAQNVQLGAIRTHLIAGAGAVGFLVAGVGGWAATTELAGAVVAAGVVVVNSNVKKIQHPIGCIVKELLVHNGSVPLHDAGAAGGAQRCAKLGGVIATVGADLDHIEGAAPTAQIPLGQHERLARAEQ